MNPDELSLNSRVPPSYFVNILHWLTNALFERFNQKVIVLIDEYDSPLNTAFLHGYYDDASKFFGSFYSWGLKGNPALKKACLMGIVEIRGVDILFGLNNLKVYSVSDQKYSQYFGFTRQEIESLVIDKSELENV